MASPRGGWIRSHHVVHSSGCADAIAAHFIKRRLGEKDETFPLVIYSAIFGKLFMQWAASQSRSKGDLEQIPHWSAPVQRLASPLPQGSCGMVRGGVN